MKKTLFEELEAVSAIRSRKDKIIELQRLRKENVNMLSFFQLTFDKRIKWLVDGDLVHKDCIDSETAMYHRLKSEVRKLSRFTNIGPYAHLPKKKLNDLFQTVLETIHPQDAELLKFVVVNRELPFKNIKPDLLKEAFPKETFEE